MRKDSSFKRESPGIARAFTCCGKEDQLMILMLVIRLAFVGRLTALIVWTRKGYSHHNTTLALGLPKKFQENSAHHWYLVV